MAARVTVRSVTVPSLPTRTIRCVPLLPLAFTGIDLKLVPHGDAQSPLSPVRSVGFEQSPGVVNSVELAKLAHISSQAAVLHDASISAIEISSQQFCISKLVGAANGKPAASQQPGATVAKGNAP